jgi:iduronate 2-sulfatase
VAPRYYFPPFLPYDTLTLPPKIPGDWDDIPKAGINYKTSENMKMDIRRQKKAVGGYYAAVAYMDAQVGRLLDALDQSGVADRTIVIFTSDHGYHLGEHDFWAKVSLRDESAMVPLIISVPGKKPQVCRSFVEMIDLYPTVTALCGLKPVPGLQGKNIAPLLDDPAATVRDTAFCAAPSSKGFLLRDDRWAYLQYGEDAANGIELFDMQADPKQYTNLAGSPQHAGVVSEFKVKLAKKLAGLRDNDLPRRDDQSRPAKK